MNQTQQRKTPLQKNLDDFSGKLAMVIMVICAVVFLLSVFRNGMSVLDSLMFAVALAVAAIPEALSSIVTIVLAMGTQKMARQNAIIKELKAVESLGSVQVICSDKTGTLTQNRMTVQTIWADGTLTKGTDLELANDAQRALLKIAVLDSDATINPETGAPVGDPTEVALVQLGNYFYVEAPVYRSQHPRLAELAFDSDRKLMSTLHNTDDGPMLFTKGAIDVLLDRSTRLLTADGPVPMTPERRAEIERINREMSENGLRVLAFAQRPLPEARLLTLDDEQDYTFVGLISMIDPPRPESVQAVAEAKKAGIRTVMITGDHKVTATAIAKQIGIFTEGDMAVDGVELDGMSDAQLDEKLPHIAVYARVSPEHKIRIVTAWQRRGCIAAMTGDGVNDAPALKKGRRGRGHGHHRHRGEQGRRRHDPGGRQLCHHRQGGAQRPQRVRQHPQRHPVPAVRQHGRHPGGHLRLAGGPERALPAGAPAVHQPADRQPARHRPGHGTRPARPDGPEAPRPQRFHDGQAHAEPRVRPGPDDRRGGDDRLLYRPGPGRRRAGQHHGLCHPDAGPSVPRLQLPRHRVHLPAGPCPATPTR